MSKAARGGYLTGVTHGEWEFVLPYLLWSGIDSSAWEHDLRVIFNAIRYTVKGGNQWRMHADAKEMLDPDASRPRTRSCR